MKYANANPTAPNNDVFDALPNIEPEGEEEVLDEEYEEEEVEEEVGVQIPSLLTTQDFISRVQQNVAASAASKVVGPVVEEYLRKVPCDDCKQLLLTEAQFPLHMPQLMLSGPSSLQHQTNLQPSKNISDVTRIIYREAKIIFSHDSSQPHILQNFTQHIMSLPELSIELCPTHQINIPLIIKKISRQALQDVLLSINQEFKAKNKEERAKKQAAKAKRVMHQ